MQRHHNTTNNIVNEDNQPKFAMDISLYRYAKQLRLLGCDVLCDEVHKQQSLIEAAEEEGRIVVTSVGKTIPLLHKFALIGDLTFGKAFESVRVVVVKNKGRNGGVSKQIQSVKKKHLTQKKRLSNQGIVDDDDDEEEEDDDKSDNNDGEKESESENKKKKRKNASSEFDDEDGDEEENTGGISGYAAFLGENGGAPTDPRKFHWVEEEDPVSKKMRKRRRRLVGYNSDGESDYEYEDDKKTESKLKQEKESQQEKDTQSEQVNNNSKSTQQEPAEDTLMRPILDELTQKLTSFVKTATPGSVSAIAANACNSALRHAQRFPNHQNPAVRYIVVDIHANFKQMLSAIILLAGVSWQPSLLFTRCVKDNVKISEVKKETVKDIVTAPIFRLYNNFYQCHICKNVFWGVDNGLAVNFKSARTTENLRSFFEDNDDDAENEMRRNGNDDDDDNEEDSFENNTNNHQGRNNNSSTSPSSSFDNANNNNNLSSTPPPRTSRQAAKWGIMPRHIFSFPRKVKVVIFDFMTHEELDNLVIACPMFGELVERKKKGLDLRFVRDEKMRGAVKAKQFHQQQQQSADEN